MNFEEIAKCRYSCRKYDTEKVVEEEKLRRILDSAILSPSACNDQPYHITVCRSEEAKKALCEDRMIRVNRFILDAPILLVISEVPYSKKVAIGAKLANNDYRSIDIGILSAYITAQAADLGLGSCIIGWLNSEKICKALDIEGTVRLVVSLGYPKDKLPDKKRKPFEKLITIK